MPKVKISEYSSTANSNTDVASINIDEGCAPSGINNAIRAVMGHLKDFQVGTNGDSFNGPVGTTTAAAGAFTTLSATGQVTSTVTTGTAPLVIASTTKVANLNVDQLDGADWAAPPAIGSGTPAAGSFTTLAATGSVTLGDAAADTVTVNGTTNFVVAPTVGGVGLNGFKNRIINGAMVIDQRNAGASVTANSGVFAADRWQTYATQSSKFTCQQSTTAPSNFKNSVLYTSSSAYTVLAGDYFSVTERIEGFNVADFGFGTATASTITLSFWVRSSLTGTFGGACHNNAFDRVYPFTYTISAANTWEQKTVTIVGDTSGTWTTDNSTGLEIGFSLGCGSTGLGTAGAWAGTSNIYGATGQVNVVGTSGATFYITGVQLEAGTAASPFEQRLYGTELALCQRYYWRWTLANQSFGYIGVGRAYSTTGGTVVVNNPVPMRASPSTNNSNNFGTANAWDYSTSAIVSNSQGTPYAQSQLGTTGNYAGDQRIFALGAGSSTSTTIWVDFSSEL
jgi:hypothetical protein